MSKEVETKICQFCESQYKLSYNPEEVSGHPKFCCFCNESWENDDMEDSSDE